MELYRKHRPAAMKTVVGNAQTLQSIESMFSRPDHPHSFLLSGPPGCGKTTIAYIMAKMVGCTNENIVENNSGNFRGIDTIRDIDRQMRFRPIGGSKVRVFIVEEVHKLTQDAQEALLKPIENCPEYCYFVFTTTNTEKINTALKTRFVHFVVESLSDAQIKTIIERILKRENKTLDPKILNKVVGSAGGSARRAISYLEVVLSLNGDADLIPEDIETQAINLCQLLMKRPTPNWSEVAAMLLNMKDDAEQVRRSVLGYMRAVLLKGKNPRGYVLMTSFASNYYDTGNAGLAMSCYEAITSLEDMK